MKKHLIKIFKVISKGAISYTGEAFQYYNNSPYYPLWFYLYKLKNIPKLKNLKNGIFVIKLDVIDLFPIIMYSKKDFYKYWMIIDDTSEQKK